MLKFYFNIQIGYFHHQIEDDSVAENVLRLTNQQEVRLLNCNHSMRWIGWSTVLFKQLVCDEWQY